MEKLLQKDEKKKKPKAAPKKKEVGATDEQPFEESTERKRDKKRADKESLITIELPLPPETEHPQDESKPEETPGDVQEPVVSK